MNRVGSITFSPPPPAACHRRPGSRHGARTRVSCSRRRGGFTLLELLLSLALISILLLAVNTFVFSMGEIWGRNTDRRLFDEHVRAVTRYLDGLLRSAALAPFSSGGADSTSSLLTPQEVRPSAGAATATVLTFLLPSGARVLPWPDRPLPDVECSLAAAEGQGLVLYWHSRLETRFHDDPPRTMVLSPLVTALTYDYYNADFKTWQNQTSLQKDSQGKWQLPARLRLRFQYDTYASESAITLPFTSEGLPCY
ncbi:MAG: prepilin-type N-terminal cleavage/methylation domain-containing protein [Opitutaceae bacterium]|nr:prepilin-type N-terminal cleavage/methylation domain-containing protein [Opitutaceae bacterium]